MILLRSRVAYSDYSDMEDTSLHSEATTATTAAAAAPTDHLCFGESDWLDFLQKLPPASFESLLSVCKKIQESRTRCASSVQQLHPSDTVTNVTKPKLPLPAGRSESMLDIPISGVCLTGEKTVPIDHQLRTASPVLYRTSSTEGGDLKGSSSFLSEVDAAASFSTTSATRPTEDLTDIQHVTVTGLDRLGTGNEDYLSLSTLASAAVAMANTSPEMSVASTATATSNALHLKPKFKALNLTSQTSTHFVKDTRQSPTIGQTPKRLAATAAALAEEAAHTEAVPLSGESAGKPAAAKRSRPSFPPELNGAATASTTTITTTTTTTTTTATTVFPVGDCGAVAPGSGAIATSAGVDGGITEGSTEVPEELISILSSSSSSTCREEAEHVAFLRSCKREPAASISFHADGELSSLALPQHRVSPTAALPVKWQSGGGLQQRSVHPPPSLAPPPPAVAPSNVHVEEGSEKSAESSRRRCKDEAVSEDEAARREKRRERNRVAAAKCRQNRQNQIENLNKKVTDLKATREDLLRRLQATETEKFQLEETIRQHGLTGCPAVSSAFRHRPPNFSYGAKPQANIPTCRDLKRTDSPVTTADWSCMVTAKQEPAPCEPSYVEGDPLPLSIPPPRSDDSGLSFATESTVAPVTTGAPSTPQFPQFPIGFSLVVLSSPNTTSLNSSIDLPSLTQQLTSAPKSSVIHAFSDQQQQQQQQQQLIKPLVSSQQTPSTRPSTLRLSESKDFDPNNQNELLLSDHALWPNGSADLSAIITPSAERWLVRDIGSGLMSPLLPKQNPPGMVAVKVESGSSSVSSSSNAGPAKSSFMPEGNNSPITILQTLESLTTPNKTFPGAGRAEEAATTAPPVSVKLASNVSR